MANLSIGGHVFDYMKDVMIPAGAVQEMEFSVPVPPAFPAAAGDEAAHADPGGPEQPRAAPRRRVAQVRERRMNEMKEVAGLDLEGGDHVIPKRGGWPSAPAAVLKPLGDWTNEDFRQKVAAAFYQRGWTSNFYKPPTSTGAAE